MPRLKLPAYGKRLLDARRKGLHPLDVCLVYGGKWFEVDEVHRVAITPEDYAPGKFDFHMLAGLRVTIYDQLAGGWEIDDKVAPPKYGKFFDLVREVAAAGAVVMVRWPKGTEPRTQLLLDIVEPCKWFDRAAGAFVWPGWWSDALQAQQIAAAKAWVDDDKQVESGRAA